MSSCRVVQYEPGLFGILESAQDLPTFSILRHRAFVDWYYGASEFCRLTMVVGEHENCLACLGSESMTLSAGDVCYRLGCLSSFYAFHPGFGFYGFSAGLQGFDAGLMLGGTQSALAFADRLRWNRGSISAYCLNISYPEDPARPVEAVCKRIVNALAARAPLRALPTRLPHELQTIQVVEQASYEADLLKFRSCFAPRIEFSTAHLTWRYALDLPFVRYRLFRAFGADRYLGFIVLQDLPERVLVAHADGIEPGLLAAGIIHSISAVAESDEDRREVMLLSSQPLMEKAFVSVGFHRAPRRGMSFALGNLKGLGALPASTAEWLINYDLGTRGFRRPFMDEKAVANEYCHSR